MPKPEHFVAPFDENEMAEVDKVKLNEKPSNLWSDAWRSLRRRPLFYISLATVLVILLMALFPTLFTSVSPTDNCQLANSNGGPTEGHPMGFTRQGCDVYARVVWGARTSLAVGLLATAISGVVGVIMGALAGFYGGWVDSVLSRLGDIFFSIPYILAAVVVMSVLADYRSVWTLAFAIGGFAWASLARILRSEILRVKSGDFVMASIATGRTRFSTLVSHVLPNSITPVIVYLTLSLGGAIVAEATLSFLGVGLPTTVMSWGNDISAAQTSLRTAPMTLIWPSIFLTVTVLAFITLGELVRDALDPKARARG
ncbi:ABC transporter permease [Demequina sp. SYSU T00192]|uniref:ABC transporter permease n=1 Tax=Demequina litoralis TaxID=3051660 RepID=A0ABT8G938_9MICO|nr:ABC transporter permease [Demequina sp. SYSU T00192]MDN4475638.1 ABC transporter permease [Demequina sp. SYSU T00192]